jgi:hypothetical protein
MDIETVIVRALSALDKGCKYESPGKMPSFDANTWPTGARCDCSGFVNWCFRLFPTRRVDHPLYHKVNGGWFETTGIHEDGMQTRGYFSRLIDPRPGALLVYPDHKGADGRHREGHIGLVLDAPAPGIVGVREVIHCSLGNWRTKQDAIQVTDAGPWRANDRSIIVWFDDLSEVH